MSSDVLIYVHIFKTGGTTLTARIQSKIGEEYHGFYNVEPERPSHYKNVKDLQFISGHDLFGVHKELKKKYHYFTMIRDPWERFKSAYFNVREMPQHPSHRAFNSLTAVEVIEDVEKVRATSQEIFINDQIDNHLIRSLSGNNKLLKPMTRENLEEAIDNIQKYFVGIDTLNNIEDFWKMLCKKFNWNPKVKKNAIHNNATIQKKALSKETQDLFMQKNKLDYELVKWISQHKEEINRRSL